MDHTVELVQAYLQVNGYFTVAEYPIVTVSRKGEAKVATDLDLLGLRFPGAGREPLFTGSRRATGEVAVHTDPRLKCADDRPDMILAEVKRGHARFNSALRDPLVVAAALMRFGCCRCEDVEPIARTLVKHGQADTHCGHRVRLVAFGSQTDGEQPPIGLAVSLRAVIEFLQRHLRAQWPVLHSICFSNSALELLALMERMAPGVPVSAKEWRRRSEKSFRLAARSEESE